MKAARIFLFMALSGAAACTHNASHKTTENTGAGAIYGNYCQGCHGADGTAGIGGAANLQTSRLDTAAISNTIANGRNAMPAFKSALTQNDIRQLKDYVLTLRK